MPTFEEEYQKLNPAQKAAVDTIYGPVMVVAGPGTGKTQLLSMRVANILRETDVLPRNILCLTFTESAQKAMRERLLRLIGSDAHKVAIHTFHSFGVEVINQYPQYFYNGARFTPTDEIMQMEIIREILQELSHDNPLTSSMNDTFVYLRDINQSIGHLKKAGLAPGDLRSILEDNQSSIEQAEPPLQEAFDVPRLSKSHLPRIRSALESLPQPQRPDLPEPFQPLSSVLRHSLEAALTEAEEAGNTKPVTAWKNQWLEKDSRNQYVLKDKARNEKLHALAGVYELYQAAMKEREQYDFSDMVLQVLQALEEHSQLRYELQEQYQFLMVDEFQDSNDGQMRLLHSLMDNPVHEGSPDIMVVGDDDQAIYKFQGAEVSNIINFQNSFPKLQIISLLQNYRSHQEILDFAREAIIQGEERLENTLADVDKTLHAANDSVETGDIKQVRLQTMEHEFYWVAQEVNKLINRGVPAREIAIIGRRHQNLESLMPHLRELDVPVAYERRRDILSEHHIEQLIDLAYAVQSLADGDQEEANEYISRVLSYPFWGIGSTELWRLSRQAYEERKLWLDVMMESDSRRLQDIARFLLDCGKQAVSEPLEYVLDRLTGSSKAENFTSPYKEYYFSKQKFNYARGEYIAFLSALKLLRDKLREYRQKETVYLRDFVEFIELHWENSLPIVDETPFVSSDDSVQVMSAHKAKGLEFHTVFVLNCQESIWARGGGRQQIVFPANIPIAPPGDKFDDQLRLFYVALTRAKSNLYITAHLHDAKGKESLPVPFLDHDKFDGKQIEEPEVERALSSSWQSYHPLPRTSDAQAVLKPILEQYQLNVTHFLKFLNVAWAGPHTFLLESLLQFPQAQKPSAAYGTAIHATLKEAYRYMQQNEALGIDAVIEVFEDMLARQRLRTRDHDKYLEQGKKELRAYLDRRYDEFSTSHLIETSFKNQGVMIGEANLSGQIDKLVLDKKDKICSVHDFKTGKPLKDWKAGSGSDGMKAWRYKTQLIFYKLLVEESRTWSDYKVERGVLEFLQPLKDNIIILEYGMDEEEVDRAKKLIQAVWECVQNLEFPDVQHYAKDLNGIRQFENDLLEKQTR